MFNQQFPVSQKDNRGLMEDCPTGSHPPLDPLRAHESKMTSATLKNLVRLLHLHNVNMRHQKKHRVLHLEFFNFKNAPASHKSSG